MTDLTSDSQGAYPMDAETENFIQQALTEMRRLNVLIQQEQVEINRLKAESKVITDHTDTKLSSLHAQLDALRSHAQPMLKPIVEFAKQLITLTTDVQQCKSDVKELRQHEREQDKRIDQLVDAIQELTFALQHDRDMSTRDRENLILRLENALLRFERRLPPTDQEP